MKKSVRQNIIIGVLAVLVLSLIGILVALEMDRESVDHSGVMSNSSEEISEESMSDVESSATESEEESESFTESESTSQEESESSEESESGQGSESVEQSSSQQESKSQQDSESKTENESKEESVPPIQVESVPEIEPEANGMANLFFAGDVYLTDTMQKNYDQKGLDGVLSSFMQQAMQQADITMINQEFPFSDRGKPMEDKQYTFRISPRYVSLFQRLGVDIVTLANNHTLDYGKGAMQDTMETLDQAGITRLGAGNSLQEAKGVYIQEVEGIRVGFIAASRVIPVTDWNVQNSTPGLFTAYDTKLLVQEVKACQEECDYVIVYLHWGIERQNIPRDKERAVAYELIDAGVDLVIGAHPHVLQSVEYYKGKAIFYSLGNFIFNVGGFDTMGLQVDLQKAEDGSIQDQFTIIPARSKAGITSELTGAAGQNLLDYIEEISFNVDVDENGRVREILNE